MHRASTRCHLFRTRRPEIWQRIPAVSMSAAILPIPDRETSPPRRLTRMAVLLTADREASPPAEVFSITGRIRRPEAGAFRLHPPRAQLPLRTCFRPSLHRLWVLATTR